MDSQSGDIIMHDENASNSMEAHAPNTQATASSLFDSTQNSAVPESTHPAVLNKDNQPSALRGAGVKREDATFDYILTGRKDDVRPAKFGALPYASSQTGLVYDVRMRFHVEPIQVEEDIHPEDPRRIHAIYESFADAGLAWRDTDADAPSHYYMGRIEAREVTKEEVCLVHTAEHYEWVQGLQHLSNAELENHEQHPGNKMDSVYLSRSTPFCAALSAGGAIEACRAVLLGKVKNVFAIIRPPGHHAEREDAKGFCFFDNVSIATKACQREFGDRCRKVLILDWDVHHGNGIQQANYDDPNVLYISLHVHQKGMFYPELSYRDKRGPYGDHLHCGSRAGVGKNVNIPWQKRGMGDADYIYAFQQVVMPIANEFQPDLVIVAAGFDAARGDMLGGCDVTPAGYAHMTHMLMSLANGRVVVCLEGGYNLESIAKSSTAVARTLMGEPPERLDSTTPTTSGVDDVKLVVRQQSRYWSSLYPKDLSARLADPLSAVRLNDVVRRWQAEVLWDNHQMIPLAVYNNTLHSAFDNQVLATQNYATARPLLIVLHDPPEVLASPDPRTGKIELHNTWLTDIVKTYVNWAAKQGFAVIDVNLPKHNVDMEDTKEDQPNDSNEYRIREATRLLTYIWDNYVDLNESTHVFLMGTNTGHGAIVNFIKRNEDRAQERLDGAISFVQDVSLQSCKSATNDMLSDWYYRISQVYAADDHSVWSTDLFTGKVKKRFGRIKRSQAQSITEMLLEHREDVIQLLSERTNDWDKDDAEEQEDGMDIEVEQPTPVPQPKLPPVGNFALSPRTYARSSRNTSPIKTPPASAFDLSPRPRPSRSPLG